jgi:hypothetical protein
MISQRIKEVISSEPDSVPDPEPMPKPKSKPKKTTMMSTPLTTFSILFTLVIVLSLLSTMINDKYYVVSRENIEKSSSLVQRKPPEPPSSDQLMNIEETKKMMNVESDSLSLSTPNLRNGNSSNMNKKPLFVLHIGPPKTGTTTLQCELGLKYPNLKQENFYYLGTYYAPLCGLPIDHRIEGFSTATRPVLLHCYAPHANKGCDLDKQWLEFASILESHKDHNVIMSDEMFQHLFEQDDVQRFAKLLQPHWDVRIVYAYRHFYSTLPSLHHQLNDPYATTPGMPYAVEKTMWPKDGGYKIMPFRSSNYFYISQEIEHFFHWVIAFGNVNVFDMQNTNGVDYLPAFLCTMIPEAKSLCQQQSQTEVSLSSDSSSHNDNNSASKYLHYDMLAVAAHEQGLLDHTNNMTREMVRDAVQVYCEAKKWTSIDHFPLDCLSDLEMESFLDESLRLASMLQPYFANPREISSSVVSLEDEIRTGFQSFREKKKFCSINAERALEEEHWRQFFSNLN